MNSPQPSPKIKYLVHHQGRVEGPFDADFVEGMVMAGVYPQDVRIQRTDRNEITTLSQMLGEPPSLQATTGALGAVPPVLPNDFAQIQRPIRWETKLALGAVIVGAIFFIWMFSEISSSNSSGQNRPTSNYSPQPQQIAKPPTTATAKPQNIYPAPATAKSYTPIVSPPQPRTFSIPSSPSVVDDSKLYRDASGHTYRVSNSDYYRLLTMKSSLDVKNRVIDQSKEEIQPLQAQIERSRIYLDRTSQYAVDSFNRDVARFNAMNDNLQTTIDTFNREVRAFNAELERVGTLIR